VVRETAFVWVRRVALLSTAGLVALVALLGLVAAVAWTGILHLPYPSRQDYPVQGVDVSNHQEAVDWQRVRAAGYEFAYVKASEGRTFTDPEYVTLSTGARQAGLKVGPYHYFTFCSAGAAQAERFIATTGGPVAGDLPPVVDLEYGGNCSRRPGREEFDREYAAFDAAVTAAFGRPPVLYAVSDFADEYLAGAQERGSRLAGRRLWVHATFGRPSGGCERWTIWQFSTRGRIDGIEGPVDLDAFCGNRDEFRQFVDRTT
jgi:lysozyme